MFRRFMIVCWVLFSLAAVSAGITWMIHAFNEAKYRQTVIDAVDLNADASSDEVLERYRGLSADIETTSALLVELDSRITKHESDGLNVQSKLPNSEYTFGDLREAARKFASKIRRLTDARSKARVYRERQDTSAVVAVLAGLSALALLLWNIIWHTTHWIWMGRDPKRAAATDR